MSKQGRGDCEAKDTWTVRPAEPTDHGRILEINAEGEPGVSAMDEAKLLRLAAIADPLLIASGPEGVAGYLMAFTPQAQYDGACFTWFRQHRPGSLYIDRVAIGRSARRRGAGSALYRAIEDAARARALGWLSCEVNLDPPNPGSMRFHEARGFREVGTLEVPDGRRVSLQMKALEEGARTP